MEDLSEVTLLAFSSEKSSSSGNISKSPLSTRAAHRSSFFTKALTLSDRDKMLLLGPCSDIFSVFNLSNIPDRYARHAIHLESAG